VILLCCTLLFFIYHRFLTDLLFVASAVKRISSLPCLSLRISMRYMLISFSPKGLAFKEDPKTIRDLMLLGVDYKLLIIVLVT